MQLSDKLENPKPFVPISGRDEMNLVEIPFTLLTNRVERQIKTIQGPNWIITGSDKFGLPVAIDEEVYVAMMKFTKDHDFQHREIPFSRYQMVNLMGWDRTGKSYNRVREALDRLAGVYIRTDAFWDNRLKQNVSQGFHILESYLIAEGRRGRKKAADQMDLSFSTFTWNETIFNSFQGGYIKLLDTERYFRLTLPTSKRAYRFLDKRLYQRDSIEVDLYEYAYNCLGLSRDYRYPSKIKEKLNPSFQELITDGFLEGVSYRETEEGVAIVISKAMTKRLGTHQYPGGPEQDQGLPSLLVDELGKRGVSSDVATRLVATYPSEQIEQKIEAFDWLLKNKSPYVRDNPPGFLRKSIERNWHTPVNFVSRAEQERRRHEAKVKQVAEEEDSLRVKEVYARATQERERQARESPWRDLWEQVSAAIAAKVQRKSFQTWFVPCFIKSVGAGERVVIDCPSDFIADWLEEQYCDLLRNVIREVTGHEHEVVFQTSDLVEANATSGSVP